MRSNEGSSRFAYKLALVAILISVSSAVAADDGYTPVYNPTLNASKAAGEIKIDGRLNDSGWRGAAKAENFAEHRPGDQTKPAVKTEAFITFSDDHLYVAFICYDDPKLVRATMCERDGSIGADDNICLLIDTYGDASWAYELNVNPYGVQADAIWSNYGGEDSGYDLIWKSAGMVTDSGYQIEMAVPFSSLRFPNTDVQTWKIDFWRNHPRETRYQYSWAAYDREEPCWPCQWGTITGIAGVQPGKGIEIMPAFIGYQSGELNDDENPDSPFSNDDPDGDVSLNAKYAISSNVIAEATYNPDFSQVEADAGQIDVNSTYALYYPESRPFFQEGSDLFTTIFTATYTRSINNPIFASKVTARLNRTSLAYLAARDENSVIILPGEESNERLMGGKSTSNIFRGRRSFGDDSHLGMLITDRHLDGGGSGTLLSADGKLRLSKEFRTEWQFIRSYTVEPEDWGLSADIDGVIDTVVVDDAVGSDTLRFDTLKFDDGAHTLALDGETFWGHAV